MASPTTTIAAMVSSAVSAAPSCITATPGKNGRVPPEDCRSIWFYDPSIPAAILVSTLFGISTVIHIIQASHYRMRFCWVIIMAGIWETTGFILRIISAQNQTSLQIYIPEELLILLSPIWVNAFDYMLLGRMVYYFLPEQKILGLRAVNFAKFFVTMDISAFVIQAIGGTILSQGGGESISRLNLGLHIYEAGVGVQEAFILCFFALAIVFHRRMLQLERKGTLELNGKTKWRQLLYALYASLTLITIRIIFRLAQYSSGFTSAIPTHEVYFYALEALPMVLALYVMNLVHPGRTFIGPGYEFAKKTKEEKRAEKEAKKAARLEQKKTSREGAQNAGSFV